MLAKQNLQHFKIQNLGDTIFSQHGGGREGGKYKIGEVVPVENHTGSFFETDNI
jgi:hypothetical protein